MNARTGAIASHVFGDDLKKILPLIYADGSDSAMFDNCSNCWCMAGRALPHAMMMMIPGSRGNITTHGRRTDARFTNTMPA